MSNYRVRQVLELGPMPDRQLRFLVALATWLPDDTRTVRVGFGTLIENTGNTHNTVRKARRELEAQRKLASQGGRGKGNLTVWTALCLPETAGKGTSDVDPFSAESKGTSDVGTFTSVDNSPKGTNHGPQKVPNDGSKRYQGQLADQVEPEMGFNSRANTLGSISLSADERENDDSDEDEDEDKPDPDAELLAGAVPGADWRDVEGAITTLQIRQHHGEIRSVRAYLRTLISNGDAKALVDDAATERRRADIEIARTGDPFGSPAPASTAGGYVATSCSDGNHGRCLWSWCECRCHAEPVTRQRPWWEN